MGPGVPGVKVKVSLCGRAYSEVIQAATIVVELHPDEIEVDGPIQHRVVREIRVEALRRRGQVITLACISSKEGPKLVGKGRHVGDDNVFKVEIEPVDD